MKGLHIGSACIRKYSGVKILSLDELIWMDRILHGAIFILNFRLSQMLYSRLTVRISTYPSSFAFWICQYGHNMIAFLSRAVLVVCTRTGLRARSGSTINQLSPMISAENMKTLVSFSFHASRWRPALWQVSRRKVNLSHPYSVATWGSKRPEWKPFVM